MQARLDTSEARHLLFPALDRRLEVADTRYSSTLQRTERWFGVSCTRARAAPRARVKGNATGMGARWVPSTPHTALLPLKLATEAASVWCTAGDAHTERANTTLVPPSLSYWNSIPMAAQLPLSPPSLPSTPCRLLKIGQPKGQRLQQCVNDLIPSS